MGHMLILISWFFLTSSSVYQNYQPAERPIFEIQDLVTTSTRPGVIVDSDYDGKVKWHIIHFIDNKQPEELQINEFALRKLPQLTFHYINTITQTQLNTLQKMDRCNKQNSVLVIPMNWKYQAQKNIYGFADVTIDLLLNLITFVKLLHSPKPSIIFDDSISISASGTRIINLNNITGALFHEIFLNHMFQYIHEIIHFCDSDVLFNVFNDILPLIEPAMEAQMGSLYHLHLKIKKDDPHSCYPYLIFTDVNQSISQHLPQHVGEYQLVFDNDIAPKFYIDAWIKITSALIKKYSALIMHTIMNSVIDQQTDEFNKVSNSIRIINNLSMNLNAANVDQLLAEAEYIKESIERNYLRLLVSKLMFEWTPRNVHLFINDYQAKELTGHIRDVLVDMGLKYPWYQLLGGQYDNAV